MIQRTLGGTLLILMSVLIVSCQDAVVGPSSAVPEPRSEAPLPSEPYLSPEYLAHLWQVSEDTDYEWLTGTVDVVTGGNFTASPTSWSDPRCVFSVTIPAGALQLGNPVSVATRQQISIGVPRPPVAGEPTHPAVFLLEPDGLEFNLPVTVTFSSPPWRSWGGKVEKFCLFDKYDGTFGYSEFQVFLGRPVRTFQFQTNHFSRWPVEDGKGG